jgi:ATP-dependent DNA helicase PIF1
MAQDEYGVDLDKLPPDLRECYLEGKRKRAKPAKKVDVVRDLSKVLKDAGIATDTTPPIPVGDDPPLSVGQMDARDAALRGENIFISGPAGVGKSVTLRKIVSDLRSAGKRVAVTASTGVAAVNVSGQTIHSFLGTGIIGDLSEAHQKLPSNHLNVRPDTTERLRGADVLVIDEISMLTGKYMEMMSWWMSMVRQNPHPAGGVQVIITGDFLQLAPVAEDDNLRKLFAFKSMFWKLAGMKTYELKDNFRQDDPVFQDHLMRIRAGKVGLPTEKFFAECVGRKMDIDPTHLFTHNEQVYNMNMSRLRKLPGDPIICEADVFGHDDRAIEKVVKSCIADYELHLKMDAPVLLLHNNREAGYVNGSRGTVRDVNMVKNGDGEETPHSFTVELTDGRVVEVEQYTWKTEDMNGKTIASMTQFPIKLAWAMTIHKSQGMTLDYAHVDIEDCFASGQAYVALSRLRTVAGLRLASPLKSYMVKAHPEALAFYGIG